MSSSTPASSSASVKGNEASATNNSNSDNLNEERFWGQFFDAVAQGNLVRVQELEAEFCRDTDPVVNASRLERLYTRRTRKSHKTALLLACFHRRTATALHCLERSPTSAVVNARDAMGFTALLWAVAHNLVSVVDHLLEHPQLQPNIPKYNGNTALHTAARNGRVALVRRLLQHPRVQVHVYNDRNETPLHAAVLGATRHHQAATEQNNNNSDAATLVDLLLGHPAVDVALVAMADHGKGNTVVHWASAWGLETLLPRLLRVSTPDWHEEDGCWWRYLRNHAQQTPYEVAKTSSIQRQFHWRESDFLSQSISTVLQDDTVLRQQEAPAVDHDSAENVLVHPGHGETPPQPAATFSEPASVSHAPLVFKALYVLMEWLPRQQQ